MAVRVIEEANGCHGNYHRPSNWERARVATAATSLPTSADMTKLAATPITESAILERNARWLIRMAPCRMMNPPDRSWPVKAADAVRLK